MKIDPEEKLSYPQPIEASLETFRPVPIPKASLASRFIAQSIDGIVLTVTISIITACANSVQLSSLDYFTTIVGVLIQAIYFTRAYATTGQTFGKRLLKIQVVSIDGARLTWRQGFLRWIGYYISWVALGVGYLWAIWDKDNQAWHDKISGTVVVKEKHASDRPNLDPNEARRSKRRWQVALGGLTALGVALVGIFLLINYGQTNSEINAMQPWPQNNQNPAEVLPPDLDVLGLGEATIVNARGSDTFWDADTYDEGAIAEYAVSGEPAVWIVALHYPNATSASIDFDNLAFWAKENCGRSNWSNIGKTGKIECSWSDEQNITFWNDTWIIDMEVLNLVLDSPTEVIDTIRDALIQHWQTLELQE